MGWRACFGVVDLFLRKERLLMVRNRETGVVIMVIMEAGLILVYVIPDFRIFAVLWGW